MGYCAVVPPNRPDSVYVCANVPVGWSWAPVVGQLSALPILCPGLRNLPRQATTVLQLLRVARRGPGSCITSARLNSGPKEGRATRPSGFAATPTSVACVQNRLDELHANESAAVRLSLKLEVLACPPAAPSRWAVAAKHADRYAGHVRADDDGDGIGDQLVHRGILASGFPFIPECDFGS